MDFSVDTSWTHHSWTHDLAATHGTDKVHMPNTFPLVDPHFQLPQFLQESRELNNTLSLSNSPLVVVTCQPPAGVQGQKISQLSSCFLIPQKRVCLTDHQVWRYWLGHPAGVEPGVVGINKSTMCKDALGLLDSHLLLTWQAWFSWAEMLKKAKNWVTFWDASWQSGPCSWSRSRLSSVRETHSQQGLPACKFSDTSQWGLGPESQVPRGITCSFTLPCLLCATILRINYGEVAGSTDWFLDKDYRVPQPSWDSSHETVRGYGNRQTYLPVQDLVLVLCLSLSAGWPQASDLTFLSFLTGKY